MTSQRRSRPEAYRPPAEFGQRAIELAKATGKTPDELVRAVGYESRKTLDRLAKGDGSLEFALAIRDQLEEWGADVSTLPSLGVGGRQLEDWERDWLELGRKLYRLASDKKYAEVVESLRDLIEAHEKVALGTGAFSRKR